MIEAVSQAETLPDAALGPRESAEFFHAPRYDALECLAASFRTHRYALHTHETYVVGCILAGVETFLVDGERQHAGPGDVCFVEPDAVHDGEPLGEGYAYRMAYPSIALLSAIAAEVTGRAPAGPPRFRRCTVYDPTLAARFAHAHAGLRAAAKPGRAASDTLGVDEMFVGTLAEMLLRHSDCGAPARVGAEPQAVGRVRALLDEHFAEPIGLDELAGVAGLSRTHLIRAFRAQTGLTPHAYLVDRRVRAARRRLALGEMPGEVALTCGFADQAHLTRVFKARVGVAPGAFRVATMGSGRRPPTPSAARAHAA